MVHELDGINLIALNRFGTLKYCAGHNSCWEVSSPIDLDVNIFLIGVDSPEPQVNEESFQRTIVLGAVVRVCQSVLSG